MSYTDAVMIRHQIFVGTVIIVGVLIIILILSNNIKRSRLRRYVLIQRGMSGNDVVKIMGNKFDKSIRANGIVILAWSFKKSLVEVAFRDCQVVEVRATNVR